MFESSLHYPDRPEWKQEPAYEDAVATLLTEMFKYIERPDYIDNPYQRTVERAEHCLTLSMSSRQRMLVRWAQSMGYMGLTEWRHGSDCLDDALELAEQLDDLSSCAEIAFLNGSACAADLNYESASEYNNHALSLLHLLSRSGQSIDPDFEAHILLNLASSHFTLEMYDQAKANLTQAHALIAFSDTKDAQDAIRARQIANIYWIDAVLQRWVGEPSIAWRLALKAYDLYAHMPSAGLLSQIATLSSATAETALYLAETISTDIQSEARITYLDAARPYVETALEAAYKAQDEVAAGLALLADVRYQIARGQPVDFEPIITSVLKTANDRHNPAVAIQAYTTLGNAFSAHGRDSAAADCYQQAISIAKSSRLPSMSVWARRALHWKREMS